MEQQKQEASTQARDTPKKWYKTVWGILLIIFFWPFILFWYMWAKTKWNIWIKVAITLVLVIAVIANSDDDKSEIKSEQKASQENVKKDDVTKSEKNDDIPLLGDEFLLKYDEETDEKIFIVDTEENYIAFAKSSVIKDAEGSTEIFKKHVISVDNGTRVRVIEYVKSNEGITYKGIKVRVLEGDKYNSVGYTMRHFLRKINGDDTKSETLDSSKNSQAENKETQDLKEYADIITESLKEANDGYNASKNAAIFGASNNYSEANKELDKAEKFYSTALSKLNKVTPPDKFKEMHNFAIDGVNKFKQANTFMKNGLSKQDVNSINRAGELLDEGNALLLRAIQEFNKNK